MARHQRHGITKKTAENMIVDVGAVYLNYGVQGKERLWGATSGGASFEVEQEIKEIEADGLRGKGMGFRRKITENATLTINALEHSPENFHTALPGSVLEDLMDDSGIEVIGKKIRSGVHVTLDDYVDNIALVGNLSSGQEIVIILHNALADDNLTLETEDKEEAVPEIKFSAHYDPDDLEAPIYEIRYPNVETPGSGVEG